MAPLMVSLGGPTSGVARGGASLSAATVAWGAESGRWDVLATLVGLLAATAEAGESPDEQLVNEALATRFGPGLPRFPLGAQ